MAMYFDELLLIPVFVIPFLFALRLISKKIALCLWLSFLISSICNIFFDNSLVSIVSLVVSINVVYLISLIKRKSKKRNYSFAVIVGCDEKRLVYYDGKDVKDVPNIHFKNSRAGQVIKVTKLIDN